MSAITPEEIVDSAAISSAAAGRKSLWALALRNPSVILGGMILLIMVTIAILAPFLGTDSRHDESRSHRRNLL